MLATGSRPGRSPERLPGTKWSLEPRRLLPVPLLSRGRAPVPVRLWPRCPSGKHGPRRKPALTGPPGRRTQNTSLTTTPLNVGVDAPLCSGRPGQRRATAGTLHDREQKPEGRCLRKTFVKIMNSVSSTHTHKGLWKGSLEPATPTAGRTRGRQRPTGDHPSRSRQARLSGPGVGAPASAPPPAHCWHPVPLPSRPASTGAHATAAAPNKGTCTVTSLPAATAAPGAPTAPSCSPRARGLPRPHGPVRMLVLPGEPHPRGRPCDRRPVPRKRLARGPRATGSGCRT